MFWKYFPRSLWCYRIPYGAKIFKINSSFSSNLQVLTPLEALTGETPDISQYLDFGFYDIVWFEEDAGLGETKLGRFLGVSHHVGSLMSYWVIPIIKTPISITTVQRVNNLESATNKNQKRFEVYGKRVAYIFKEEYIEANYL